MSQGEWGMWSFCPLDFLCLKWRCHGNDNNLIMINNEETIYELLFWKYVYYFVYPLEQQIK